MNTRNLALLGAVVLGALWLSRSAYAKGKRSAEYSHYADEVAAASFIDVGALDMSDFVLPRLQ